MLKCEAFHFTSLHSDFLANALYIALATSNPQLGQLFAPRPEKNQTFTGSSSKKPRFENMPSLKNGWGRKGVAKRNRTRMPAHALDLLARAAKDYTKVFKRRKLSLHKIMETKNTTAVASKQLQLNVAARLDGVANGIEVPQEQSLENSVQEQRESSTERTRTRSDNLPSNIPCVKVESEASKEDDSLVDFWCLTRIPRCHASLIEKECNDHPQLAIYFDRTPRWHQFAYETLGELLFFLHSTRGGEMTVEKRTHLERLWEDARGLGFDLSWLEPGVRFGLDLGSYMEQQKEAVAMLETEMRRLDKDMDTLQCQLSTLIRLLFENKGAHAALELVVQRVKGNLKSAEETFLYERSN